ncbi:MAG: hypothetical protein EOM67_03405 [Spirochaetia bacterium]|nr:hypothetical protein [Spirochaetia bacterium]
MANHILDEIFTFEDKAQEIVNEAKQKVQEQLNQVRATGEREYSEALILMRKNREQEIEKAQRESEENMKKFEQSLIDSSDSIKEINTQAQNIAHVMANLMLKTDLGECK